MALPDTASEFMTWTAEQIQPYVDEVISRPLTAESMDGWLLDTQKLGGFFQAWMARLDIATDLDTADEDAQRRLQDFRRDIFPLSQRLWQAIDSRMLENEALLPPGLEIPMRAMKVGGELFTDAAEPLLNEESRLCGECNSIFGAQTVEWQGQELTLRQHNLNFQNQDRALREQAWHLMMARRAQDRAALSAHWSELFAIRLKLAAAAGFPNYIEYRFRDLGRFDYTPADSLRFHDAVETVVVPALTQVFEKRRQQLGVETLRPWDLDVDPSGKPPLKPFRDAEDLVEKSSRVFYRIDPEFGAFFDEMRARDLLVLGNRKNRGAVGGFTRVIFGTGTFLFMNLTGTHGDMVGMMHELGHAFHHYSCFKKRYIQQMMTPADFNETPSTVMELLSMPCWDEFYQDDDLQRAQHSYWAGAFQRWVETALFDAFQHWAYAHPAAAADPDQCAAHWAKLIERFMPGVDWSGLEDERAYGWLTPYPTLFRPLFGPEYTYGQFAAMHIWREVQHDHHGAIQRYKNAISLGNTVTVPEMFAALNTPFPFDADDLRAAVAAVETALA
ncbi:MAG: M3 family oligoendopeptidase [Chloroflexi bacterium]|nr:M3 family oligoendopeptidase [Chloroflexota bacterium]